MLAFLGLAMVATFMALIMTKRLLPLVALTLVPLGYGILAALLGYFPIAKLGPMMLEDLKTLAPTGVMLLFAILYFALMIDTGLFEGVVAWILRRVKGDPLKVALGTVALTLVVSLDGDGSTTYMICVAALLPLYQRLGMNTRLMTCLMLLSSAVMNLTPWGGPTARAASALHVDPSAVFVPMIPAMLCGIAAIFILAWVYGRRERERLGIIELPEQRMEGIQPRLLWFNGLLTVALMTCLILAILPMPVLFMAAFGIALSVNYPALSPQKERIAAHAESVLAVVSLIFAAGIFTGILSGSGMVEALSKSLIAFIPEALGPHLAVITALLSLPFTFFLSNDAFYFGMLPVLAEAAGHYGISPVALARASLVGQPVHLLSPLVPSTYLLVGLAKVELGDHQRFTLRWAVLVALAMLLGALVTATFP
ncbi:CitMHS family transporter [Armatimonas sp.]|uniref:CitMHS family transporter n=1 Tax=Armatimonas sp. TaxID=1872638 RepID=UPI00286A9D0F|nr:CitMHS family transporter [Armatimonas sp.]